MLTFMKIDVLLEIFISVSLIYACYTDIRWRRISNKYSLVILLLSLVLGCYRETGVSVLIPALILLTGFAFSLMGLVGAGDIKLVSALAVALSPQEAASFLTFIGLAGIPLTLIVFLHYRFLMPQKKATIPYGVAISLGYWFQWFYLANYF
jgi:prepilin peptidase CpaA